jgi:hypothetical protein
MFDVQIRGIAGIPALMRRAVQIIVSSLVFALAVAADAGDPPAGGLTEAPFATHPFPRGSTMFTEIPSGSSGLQLMNPYDDPKMRGDLYLEFEGGSIGTGVAIGDYDGDGRPDIFVATKTKGCRLFRNLGGYKFEDVTEEGWGRRYSGCLEPRCDVCGYKQ